MPTSHYRTNHDRQDISMPKRRVRPTGGEQLDQRLMRRVDGQPFRNLRPRYRPAHKLGSPFMRARDLMKGDVIELGDGRHVTILTQAYSFNDTSVHLEILGDDGLRAEYQLRFFGNDPVKVVYTPNARPVDYPAN